MSGNLAEPETLLGGLQRGLGRAYLEALSKPEVAAPLVVDCIVHDPRWDRQVEHRDWFYGSLVNDLQIDLGLLRQAYEEAPNDGHGDGAAWLAVEIFSMAARRGDPSGLDELFRYLASERDLPQALEAIFQFAGPVDASNRLVAILESASEADIHEALEWGSWNFSEALWPKWRSQNKVIDTVVSSVNRTQVVPGSSDRGQGIAARIRLAQAKIIAAAEAATPGTALSQFTSFPVDENVLLEAGPAVLDDADIDKTVQRHVRTAILKLRSDRAIAWAAANANEETESGYVALRLLSDAGSSQHAELLRSLLTKELGQPDLAIYAIDSLVEGLERLEDAASFDLMMSVYEMATYSYLRIRCVAAMFAIQPTGLKALAYECLWDCEPRTRQSAIEYLANDASDDVINRVRQMHDDVTEDSEVVSTAARYLTSIQR